MRELVVTAGNQNQRLDKYLLKLFNTAPKSLVYKLLRKKRIKLNGKKASGNELLCSGDVLCFYLADDTMDGFMAEKEVRPESQAPEVIYEDENLLIANKPAGLLSHSPGEDSMIDRILFYLYKKGEYDTGKTSDFTPALCNRLDRNTSGIVLCGKNPAALRQVNTMLANREIEKYYLTLVKGRIEESGVLKGFHYKDEKSNEARITGVLEDGGKEAVTEYAPVVTNGDYTLLRIRLITGKSHQIRVHMQGMGRSVVGDPKYGDVRVNTLFKNKYGLHYQLLHGEKVVFADVTGLLEYLSGREFTAPVGGVFRRIVEAEGMCL